jgi:hypothetical protein
MKNIIFYFAFGIDYLHEKCYIFANPTKKYEKKEISKIVLPFLSFFRGRLLILLKLNLARRPW